MDRNEGCKPASKRQAEERLERREERGKDAERDEKPIRERERDLSEQPNQREKNNKSMQEDNQPSYCTPTTLHSGLTLRDKQ
jgi:hypothetical protein